MKETYEMHFPGGACEVTMDPTDHYEGFDAEELIAACGLLPGFVAAAAGEETPEEVMATMLRVYQWGSDYNMLAGDGTIEDMVYKYPEDPDLYPYVHFKVDNAEVLIYPYGLVAVTGEGYEHMTRMD